MQELFNIWKMSVINRLRKKNHEQINWSKIIWQNPIPIHDRNAQKTRKTPVVLLEVATAAGNTPGAHPGQDPRHSGYNRLPTVLLHSMWTPSRTVEHHSFHWTSPGRCRWTIKKADHRRMDAFELWCWRRLLRVPWVARRYNQSILKEISPEYSLEGLMLKLKLPCFGHLIEELTHLKRPWCWERLKAGEGDDRGWDGWMASLTQWTWVWVNSGCWW